MEGTPTGREQTNDSREKVEYSRMKVDWPATTIPLGAW